MQTQTTDVIINELAGTPSLRTGIPVYYSPDMVVRVPLGVPSPKKPSAVVKCWGHLGIPLEIKAPRPVTPEQVMRVHDDDYVHGILEGSVPSGIGTVSAEIAQSFLHTSGAMLAAAREAIRNRAVAVAPVSGFHHAHHDKGYGYCTFNGLLVAAAALHVEDSVRRVGILDCDHHFGDGTVDIIQRLGLEYVQHFTAGREYYRKTDATRFFRDLPQALMSFQGCDVVLYQAGADPHVDDPLGGWLTTEELRHRDGIVFSMLASLGIPVAWNLAGGYQTPVRKVLEIHDNTMRECAAAHLG